MARARPARQAPLLHTLIVGVGVTAAALLAGAPDRLTVLVAATALGLARGAGWWLKRYPRRWRKEAPPPSRIVLHELLIEAQRITVATHGIRNELAALIGELELALEEERRTS